MKVLKNYQDFLTENNINEILVNTILKYTK
jgi:hypothetical protein